MDVKKMDAMKATIRPLLMDEERSDLVIFLVEREGAPKAYLWVLMDDDDFNPRSDIRITSFYAVCSYCTHTTDPFYAGKDIPADMVEKALKRLSECPDEIMRELIDGFNQDIKWKMENKELFKEYTEWEKETFDRIAEVNVNGGDGLIYI